MKNKYEIKKTEHESKQNKLQGLQNEEQHSVKQFKEDHLIQRNSNQPL